MKKLFLVIVAVPLALVSGGCGKKQTEAISDMVPFESAITAYLDKNSMGMKIGEIKSLSVSGDTATGTVSMKEADDLYNVNVKWEFTFQKNQDGWEAISYRNAQ